LSALPSILEKWVAAVSGIVSGFDRERQQSLVEDGTAAVGLSGTALTS
jgi:hypothetical protein